MSPLVESKTGLSGEASPTCPDWKVPLFVVDEVREDAVVEVEHEVSVWIVLDVIVSVKFEVAVMVSVEVFGASKRGATITPDEIKTAATIRAAARNE